MPALPTEPVPIETTWLEQIIHVGQNDQPQGPVLLITLANGHRYAIPLFGEVRQAVHRIASPFTVASRVPPVNGSGTRLPG